MFGKLEIVRELLTRLPGLPDRSRLFLSVLSPDVYFHPAREFRLDINEFV